MTKKISRKVLPMLAVMALAFALAGCGGSGSPVNDNGGGDTTPAFVPVTGITGVPASGTVGTPLTLTGTAAPGNATNSTIVWSVHAAGSTGASITTSCNILTATYAGTVTVTATIADGTAVGTAFTQDFDIEFISPFVGTWQVVGSWDREYFIVYPNYTWRWNDEAVGSNTWTLNSDGTATSAGGNTGTWTLSDNNNTLIWDGGWINRTFTRLQ